MVARALGATDTVTSVDSLEGARQALAAKRFDLAVLDIELGPVSGLDRCRSCAATGGVQSR
jgi:DNA-binding response OmpR family regulator